MCKLRRLLVSSFPCAVDGNRTFIYVETAYIAKWWAEATDAQQATFTKYVNNGQLELVSGGAPSL